MRTGGRLYLEPGLPADVIDELKRRGHDLHRQPVNQYGGYQAIWRDAASGVYCGATESRKDGIALGY